MKNESSFSKMHTSGLIVERRYPDVALSVDLAFHMSRRCSKGTIAVATSRPKPLLSSTRKQWLKLMRHARRARSSTLNRERQEAIEYDILRLQATTFSCQHPRKDPIASICFATIEQFLVAPPICQTLYITDPISKKEQHMLASWMPRNALVVLYE